MTTFNMTEAERVAQRDLAEAQALRSGLLKELAGGRECGTELDTVEAEISNTLRQLKRFEEARAHAVEANTTAAREARHAYTVDTLARAFLEAEQTTSTAQQVLVLVAALGAKIAMLKAQRSTAHGLMIEALDNSQVTLREHELLSLHESIRMALDAATLPTQFLVAMNAAGIGERVPPYMVATDVETAASDALDRVTKLAERISTLSAQANAVEAA